ncbi:MAG: amidophosphoribosyltransferase [Sulfobacillus acidophilus]|uniref:Amidophosphoribosyltransferase n=1 Tax=Sulfobacillus acidophilus TaxID=53633 RepID=A0A2T2WGA3_9FIRM|nr:MAG: amidophosphoribosyltransferase [Sulfobacillus acidophilus]
MSLELGELHEECGVFGIWGDPAAPAKTYWGTFSLQHRGQESAGIAVLHEGQLQVEKGMGLLQDAVSLDSVRMQAGSAAIGHVRYSTSGESSAMNAQPLLMHTRFGALALAHNGNLVNHAVLRKQLEANGAIFQGTSDSEVLAHLLARSQERDFRDALLDAARQLQGGYAFVLLTTSGLYGIRDPHGIRPLVLGRTKEGSGVLASETCALDMIDAVWVRDVGAGEIVWISSSGVQSLSFAPRSDMRACAFEVVYFSRADSQMAGESMHLRRRLLGKKLAEEAPVDADVVVGVPDSSLPAAMGFAEASRLPFDFGLVKNRYIARTFIAPAAELRAQGVRLKLSAVKEVVEGRRVALVDDSLVRGTTSRHIIRLLRRAGAREVHMRIASPPYLEPCHYGIDTSRAGELAARNLTLPELAAMVGADSLAFLSPQGLLDALGPRGWCLACFGQGYPVPVIKDESQENVHVQ